MIEPSVDMFKGVRVVEFAQWVFVPVAGALLADWGAEVIKIEHPIAGDAYRGLVSKGIDQVSGASKVNQSMTLANRGKMSLALDVKSPEGREVLLALIAKADVFLTNFLPSALDKLGLGVEDLRKVNPKIIYARGHGQGVRGPDANQAAFDGTAFWARGALGETLSPPGLEYPIGQRGAIGDRPAAVQLAFGVAAALYRVARTGEPSVVDVSLLAHAIWTLSSDVLSALQGRFSEMPPTGGDPRKAPNPLVNVFKTSDGRTLSLCLVQPDRYWGDLVKGIERPELEHDQRFATTPARRDNNSELYDLLQDVFLTRTLAEWRSHLTGARFPWAPYLKVPEILDDVQVAANGYIGEMGEAEGESFRLPTGAVQFDEQPASMRRAPEFGEHTEAVLLDLGYGWEDIVKLKDARVVA